MNNLHNIASLQRTGTPSAPRGPSGDQNVQDLSGFLDQIAQALRQSSNAADAQKTRTQTSTAAKDLKEKIAEVLKKTDTLPDITADTTPDQPQVLQAAAEKIVDLLQKHDLLPESAKEIPADELTAKIALLLENNDLLVNIPTIKPSLTSDLVAGLADQIQTDSADNVPKGEFTRKLADMLNDITPGSGDTQQLEDILAALQAQQTPDTPLVPIDPALLQQLKDKVAELQAAGDIRPDAIAKLKADIIQLLTNKGIDPPGIQHYLTALVKSLKEDAVKSAGIPENPDHAAPLPVPEEHADELLTNSRVVLPKAQTQAKPEAPTAPKAVVQPDDEIRAILLREPPRAGAAPKAPPAQPTLTDTTQTPPTPQVTGQIQDPAPTQNLSAKIAGISVNPGLVNALAGGDAGFSMDGFGADARGRGPQELMNVLGSLKPVSADAVNGQHFTNYLSAARGTPHSVTQMVNIQLQRAIADKMNMMTFELEPADLGRMDIKLKFDREGGIRAHMSVDKPETLALLQRDTHHLERVLQQSGFDLDEKSLSFDLRQGGRHQNLEGFNGGNRGNAEEFAAHMNDRSAEKAIQAQIAIHAPGYINASGVNIMV